MNKQELAAKIWESANKMRSKIDAGEYKDYTLGFIFYKFLSDREFEYLTREGWTEADMKEDLNESNQMAVRNIQDNIGYFISYEDLFSTWISKTESRSFDVGNVRDAIHAFNRLISPTHKKVFTQIFNTLETGLSKLGESSGAQTKAITDLIHLIKEIEMDEKQDYDALGFVYEYLISNFAANAGKKAGEFYTPHEVSVVMSEIIAHHLQDKDKIEIYDPTSGSGSLLLNIGRAFSKHTNNRHNVKYYAQELNPATYNLTRMNLVMRGILPDNIVVRHGDTLGQDWPLFDEQDPQRTYRPLYLDAVVSNPPYSLPWDPTNKENDRRFSNYGLAPKSKADYAFLLHSLFHLKPDGIMTIILPHGVLFRGGEEGNIRRNLIERNHIDAIIGLPPNIFYGTGIPTIIMVLKQKRKNTDILIVDASKGFIKDGKKNKLQTSHIKKMVDTVVSRDAVEKYSRVVSREEIRENEYNLNIPRYVDSSDEIESWDLYASMFGGIPKKEIDIYKQYWMEMPGLIDEIFAFDETPYAKVKSESISKIINDSSTFKEYKKRYSEAFKDLHDVLYGEIISNLQIIQIPQVEEKISNLIFKNIGFTKLIDKYEAYQIFSNYWRDLSLDLETIHIEGPDIIRKVVPNMVTKTRGNKDVRVQEGYIGRIIPFSAVHETILKDEANAIQCYRNRLEDIQQRFVELVEMSSEEDKESYRDCFSQENDAFINAQVSKAVKEIKKQGEKYAEETIEWQLIEADKLISEEKLLKKKINVETEKLTLRTKDVIEKLTDAELLSLLDYIWIRPIVTDILNLPEKMKEDFATNLIKLAEKYKVTYLDLENQIKETEIALSSFIDDLEGDAYDMEGLRELKRLLDGGQNG